MSYKSCPDLTEWWSSRRVDWLKGEVSPLFIYSKERLLQNIRDFRSLWNISKKNVKLYLSIKCNPNPILISHICDQFDGYDISSMIELDTVKKITRGAETTIALSGPAKTDSLMKQLSETSIDIIHFDGLDEISFWLKYCDKEKQKISLRVALDDLGSKLGMNIQEVQQAMNLLKCGDAKLSGLHFYFGKENFSNCLMNKMFDNSKIIFDKYGDRFVRKNLYFGPGVPSLSQQEYVMRERKLIDEKSFTIFDEIHIEAGRAIFESAGYYLTQILGVKELGRSRRVIIINGGSHHFAEKLVSETGDETIYQPIGYRDGVLLNDELISTKITGNQCHDRDVLHPSCELAKSLRRGDWIIFPNKGAYGITAGNNQFIGLPQAKEFLDVGKDSLIDISTIDWKYYHQAFEDS